MGRLPQLLRGLAAAATGPCASCSSRRGAPLCPLCLEQSAVGDVSRRIPGDWGAVHVLGDYYAASPSGSRLLSPLGLCLRAFKDRGDRYAGRCLARLFADRCRALVHPGDVLVPIPPDRERLRQRLLHPAGWLAAALGRCSRAAVHPAALRRRPGHPAQRGLGGPGRRDNARGAFELGPCVLEGYGVLLVDDVLTTGATMRAAALCLAGAGVAQVRGLALACADKEVLESCRSRTGRGGNAATRPRHA